MMMGHASALTPLPVAVPLLGAAAVAAVRKWMSRAVADACAIAIAGAALVICAMLLDHAVRDGASAYWFGGWSPRGTMAVGIGFVVEPIGAGLATLAAFLTTLALVFSWKLVDAGGKHLQPLMLVFLAAMCGFVLTADLFNMFVFFELMSTAAFALCGLKTGEPAPLQGAFNFAVTNTIAAFLVLTGIAMLYAVTGALNIAQIGLALSDRRDPLVLFAFTLLTCGFMVKAAIVPFHLWLPDAHAVAPTPVCVLFSGLMVELGLNAIVRLHSVIFADALGVHRGRVSVLLIAFGAVTVLLGGVMSYAEHHLKRMLAFSTVCHAGLMLVAAGVQGELAVAAMLTYVLAHALVKAAMFFVAGMLLHRLRAIGERDLFGRGRRLWGVAVLWFLGAMGLAGAPPFATMLGEAGASAAAKASHVHGVEMLFMVGGILTSAAALRVGTHTFLGWGDTPLTDDAAEVGELPETEDCGIRWFHWGPAAVCVVGATVMVAVPGWMRVLADAAAAMASKGAYLHTVYTGESVTMRLPVWREEFVGAAVRGAIALVLAAGLAATSVFRLRLRAWMRVGAWLERGFAPLRAMQSGHVGDYVFWLTTGVAVFGAAAMVLLRS